jgi:hypothetical protein
VTVVDLDHRAEAVVVEVRDGGRTVVVETLEGERLQFVLRAGAAVYTASPDSAWPRLRL